MKNYLRKISTLVLVGLSIVSCAVDEPVAPTLLNGLNYTNNVHVLYYKLNSGVNPVLSLWKNGVSTDISDETFNPARNGDMAIVNNDIYIAAEVASKRAGFWKNGLVTQLSNSISYAYGVAVSGTDVYVCGVENSNAVYWKNGVIQFLAPKNPLNRCVASDICVVGNDVYVVGVEFGNTKSVRYWKNGVGINLATALPNMDCKAVSIKLIGADVYISGTNNNLPTYWKNGIAISLPYDGAGTTADKLYTDGSNIYITGLLSSSSATSPVYNFWKNGIKTYGPKIAYITSIAKLGNDLYLAGINQNNKGSFTQNGFETVIENNVPIKILEIMVN